MAPKIFLTGVTGYIAGDALVALHAAHPEYEYAALVRTQDKADRVQAAFPDIRIVIGDLGAEVLERESKVADIVLHAADASDHEGAAKAIAKGLQAGHNDKRPGYWLHTGGTGILTYFDSEAGRLGENSDRIFNDWAGVTELTTLPDAAFHRNVDKIVLETDPSGDKGVRTAIICPPTIYGRGRGPVARRGRQVYELAKLILQKGYAPIIGEGKARWNNVHIADLSSVFVELVEAAVSGQHDADKDELWGAKGYYIVESGEHEWGALSRKIAQNAAELGFISKGFDEHPLNKEEALEVAGFEAVSWGLNSRAQAIRASKLLRWKPVGSSLEDSIHEILRDEKDRVERRG